MSNKTVNINGRVPIIDLALCALYMHEAGSPALSRSDLMWKVVTVVANSARKKFGKDFTTVADALHFLESEGLILGTSDRTKRSVAKALQEDDLSLEYHSTNTIVDTIEAEYKAAKTMAESMHLPVISFEEFVKNKLNK